jgi:argininosuccinate lyase
MAKERHRWVIYYDETLLMKMNRLREETAKKDNVDISEIAVSQVVRAITEEKYIEYANKQNNSARITTLVEKEEITAEVLADVVKELRALRAEGSQSNQRIASIEDKFDRLITFLMEERNHVRPDDN